MDPSAVLQSPAALLRAIAGDVQVLHRETTAGDAATAERRLPVVTRGGGVCVLELFSPNYGTSVVAGSVLCRWMRSEDHSHHHHGEDEDGGGGGGGDNHHSAKGPAGALRRTWGAVDAAAVFPGLGNTPFAGSDVLRAEHPLALQTGSIDEALRMSLRSMLEPFLGSLHPVFLVLTQSHIRGAPLADASTDLNASVASRAGFNPHTIRGGGSGKDGGATELWACARVFAAGSVELHSVIEGPDMPGLTRAIAAAEGLVGTTMRNLRGSVVDVAPSSSSTIDAADASFARSTVRRHTRDGSLLMSQSAAQMSGSRRRSASMSIDPAAKVLPLSTTVTVSSVAAAFALPPLAAKCHTASFKIQCAWRRRQALKRIGEFIGGKFFTHAEVAALRAKQLAEAQEAERQRIRRDGAAHTVQRVWMGHVGRCAARLRRADIQESAKLKAVYARRKTKRTSLYGSVGVPNSLEPKVRVLRKAAHAAAAAAAAGSGGADAKRRTSFDHHGAVAGPGIRSPRNGAAASATAKVPAEQVPAPGNYLDLGALTPEERTIAIRKARVKV